MASEALTQTPAVSTLAVHAHHPPPPLGRIKVSDDSADGVGGGVLVLFRKTSVRRLLGGGKADIRHWV